MKLLAATLAMMFLLNPSWATAPAWEKNETMLKPATTVVVQTFYSAIDSCHYPTKEGCLTASGKVAQIGFAACHRSLPFGTRIRFSRGEVVCEDRYARWLDDVRDYPTVDVFAGYGPGAHAFAVGKGIAVRQVEVLPK